MTGNESTRIYVTGSATGLDRLREGLATHPDLDFVGWSENVADASAALAGGHLQVVIHATRTATFPADEVAAIREHTRSPIVILASGESSALLEEALDAEGIADVLLLPQLTENVVFALRKAGHAGRRLVAEGGHTRQGRIMTVFSPKGGTGKTVMATNLAAAFAKFEDRRTLLLDLDLQFGDAAIMLGLEPDKTIYDLVVAPGELDSEKLAGYITKHTCGLDILPAPLRPEDAELVTESKLARLLEVARESYDVIVVDTSPFFHGPMLATLDRTDELLMVCGLDVPTLKNVRLSLQTLDLLSFPASRIRFLLNRANSKVGMKKSEVEGALDVKITFEVPSDRAVPLGVNRGAPPAIADTGCDFARAIRTVAKALLVQEQPKKKRKFAALARSVAMGLHDRLSKQNENGAASAAERPAALAGPVTNPAAPNAPVATPRAGDPYAELKTAIHHAVIAKLGPELFKREARGPLGAGAARRRRAARPRPHAADPRGAAAYPEEITDDVLGYGPLEELLRDDSVSEVMVNGTT